MNMRNVSRELCRSVVVTAAVLSSSCSDSSGPPQSGSKVQIVGSHGSYKLLRDGKPYTIHGVGGNGSRKLLLASGANSFRTWGAENIGQILDEAHRDGLTVTVGIWLGHAGAFNYHDPVEVKKQFDMCKQVVEKHKDHPALLMWAFGNEMEANPDDVAVWKAIEDIAAMSKAVDPNHPTMTVIADIGGDKVKNIHAICKSIDVIGINSYGGAPSLKERYQKAGGTKPYILTEFGPLGSWEVDKTRWDAPIEASSTAKAEAYKRSYQAAVLDNSGVCIGSYAFLWGNKQEATATWFGMLLPNGAPLAAVDVMSEFWTGKPRPNRVPRIDKLSASQTDRIKPGQLIRASLTASDPEGKPISVRWVLTAEGRERLTAGRDEAVPEGYPQALVSSSLTEASFKVPESGGGYRIFAYVFDDAGGAAVANVPIFVDGPVKTETGVKAELPLTVYAESAQEMPFAPSGWMGDTSGLVADFESKDSPRSGKVCAKLTFSSPTGWAGIACQFPPNDWGDQPQGLDLSGAKRLTFWMRGAQGGEKGKVEFGILKQDKKFFDTASGQIELTLTNQWKQYSIDLAGKNLSRIKTGFVLTMTGAGKPQTLYFDDVRFE